MATDISGNPLPPRDDPAVKLLALIQGIKTIDDIFARMADNSTFESFVEAGCAATGVEVVRPPMTEAEMEAPVPATREDFLSQTNNNMTLKQQFASLAKFKDVPMTYSEMRERYG